MAEYGVDCYLILHEEQIEEYKRYFNANMKKHITIIPFDKKYKLKYETCDNIPHSVKNAGSGAERNYAWDYAKNKLGAKAHWLMDDNMRFYYIAGLRKDKGYYQKRSCGKAEFTKLWHKAEDFFDKYSNLMMLELTQQDFIICKSRKNHYQNTRCFSCNLICCDMPIRWRGRYNEDVILSYDIMTAGYNIASFFGGVLKCKQSTRNARGGNHATKKGDTSSIYSDGIDYRNSSIDKTNMLFMVYPQYFNKIIKYGRVHHQYNKTALNKLNKNKKFIKAKVLGQKNINIKDFKKIKHFKIPRED